MVYVWLFWMEIPFPSAGFLQFAHKHWLLFLFIFCWTFDILRHIALCFCPDAFICSLVSLLQPSHFVFTCLYQILEKLSWKHFRILSIVSNDRFLVGFPVSDPGAMVPVIWLTGWDIFFSVVKVSHCDLTLFTLISHLMSVLQKATRHHKGYDFD